MATLTLSSPIIKRPAILKRELHHLRLWKLPRPLQRSTFPNSHLKIPPVLCTKLFPWEASGPYTPSEEDHSIMKGSTIVEPIDAEDPPELAILESEQDVMDMKKQPFNHQPLKWPMWMLGPSVLLATGMVPTLWLPLPAVFLGPNIAGLLSLVGLDCIFNMGATLFLLMADACARPDGRSSYPLKSRVPTTYRFWNLAASLLGFLIPLVMFLASHRGFLQPHLPFISFAVLLGPYLLLLSIQMLTEMLTWHWGSPVWLVTPIVYEAYRVLQLMRGLGLAGEINAPVWAVESMRGLVSWWVLILGVQLMRVASFAGFPSQSRQ